MTTFARPCFLLALCAASAEQKGFLRNVDGDAEALDVKAHNFYPATAYVRHYRGWCWIPNNGKWGPGYYRLYIVPSEYKGPLKGMRYEENGVHGAGYYRICKPLKRPLETGDVVDDGEGDRARQLDDKQRREEEARTLDDKQRREEEARQRDELQRREEEATRLDDKQRREEEARQRDELQRREEEARRLDDKQRRQEEARQRDDLQRRNEESRKKFDDAIRRKAEETQRELDEWQKQLEAKPEQRKMDDELRRTGEEVQNFFDKLQKQWQVEASKVEARRVQPRYMTHGYEKYGGVPQTQKLEPRPTTRQPVKREKPTSDVYKNVQPKVYTHGYSKHGSQGYHGDHSHRMSVRN